MFFIIIKSIFELKKECKKEYERRYEIRLQELIDAFRLEA